MTPRAAPLPPDERRRVILDAARPLVAEHGRSVRTRDVAEAAGVAEGTLFRVFATLDELVDAVVADAMDPAPFLARLDGIDREGQLEERLLAVVEAFDDRFRVVFGLVRAVGASGRPDVARLRAAKGEGDWRARVGRTVVDIIGPDARRLRVPPERLAQYLRIMSFSGAHLPMPAEDDEPSPAEVVDLVLHGVLREEDRCC